MSDNSRELHARKHQDSKRRVQDRAFITGWLALVPLLPRKPLYKPHLCRKQAAGCLRSFYILK